MSPIVIDNGVRIPAWVRDLNSFRGWACSENFPQHGWFSFLNRDVWVDVQRVRQGISAHQGRERARAKVHVGSALTRPPVLSSWPSPAFSLIMTP
jgi:hypothetical protein